MHNDALGMDLRGGGYCGQLMREANFSTSEMIFWSTRSLRPATTLSTASLSSLEPRMSMSGPHGVSWAERKSAAESHDLRWSGRHAGPGPEDGARARV